MNIEEVSNISDNWCLIKFDEHHHWYREAQEQTTAVYDVCAFNKNSATYLCESVPSYCLYHIETQLCPIEGLSDEQLKALNTIEMEEDANNDEVSYMHMSAVDHLIRKNPERFQEVDMSELGEDEDPVDNIREGFATGALSF